MNISPDDSNEGYCKHHKWYWWGRYDEPVNPPRSDSSGRSRSRSPPGIAPSSAPGVDTVATPSESPEHVDKKEKARRQGS